MDQNNDQAPDVRRIMKRIREELSGQEAPAAGPGREAPGPLVPDKDAYDLGEFLHLDGPDFVAAAYLGLLKRQPDQAGGGHFLAGLNSGAFSKVDVLGRLRFSSEGRAKKITVRGLGRAYAMHLLYRVPILGGLARIASGMAALPAMRGQVNSLARDVRAVSDCKADWDHFRNLEQFAQTLRKDVAGQSSLLGALQDRINQIEDRINGQEARILGMEKGKAESERVEQGLLALKREIRAHERLLADKPALDPPRDGEPGEAPSGPTTPDRPERLMDAGYVNFEDAFRGREEDVRQRLSAHLPVIRASKAVKRGLPVLDVGCGRGEWLRLLAEQGLPARGVDFNAVMADECRRAGLDVADGDALAHLRSLEDDSLGAVTAFHVVEHLELPDLLELFDQILRVLAPDGVAVLETPNPGNVLVGSCNFYMDPTHKNPIPAPLLAYLAESRGFARPGIRFLNPVEESRRLPEDSPTSRRFNELFYGPQDYAIDLLKT